MGDVALSDLIDPAAEARLRAAVGSAPPAPAEEKADLEVEVATGAVEFKDAASTEMEHKAIPAVPGGTQVLEADDETGRVVALVSVTGIEDRVKDIIEPGAYTKTIAEREPIGVWSHDDKTWVARTESAVELMPGDPFFNGLKTMDGKPWPKEAGAVKVESQFNLDTPHGAAAYSDVKFFKGKTGWSIGYRATKATRNMRTGVRSIKELDWFEYSPVMVGAASQPMTLSVKSLAQPVDETDDHGLVGEEQLAELTEDEVKAYFDLRESLGLEVKDIVRTEAGARRFGQPIGTHIIQDRVPAGALQVGDAVDFHVPGPGGPSDPVTAKGNITAVTHEGQVTSITVGGVKHRLLATTPIDIRRAEGTPGGMDNNPAGDGGGTPGAVSAPVISDSELQKLFGEAKTPEQKQKVRDAMKLKPEERHAFLAQGAAGGGSTPSPAAPPAVPAGGLDSAARSADKPAPEDARLKDQRQQAAVSRDRADNAAADAKVKDQAELAALNRKRKAQGKPPLLKIPVKTTTSAPPAKAAVSPMRAKLDKLKTDAAGWSDKELADYRKRQVDLANSYDHDGMPAKAKSTRDAIDVLDQELERRKGGGGSDAPAKGAAEPAKPAELPAQIRTAVRYGPYVVRPAPDGGLYIMDHTQRIVGVAKNRDDAAKKMDSGEIPSDGSAPSLGMNPSTKDTAGGTGLNQFSSMAAGLSDSQLEEAITAQKSLNLPDTHPMHHMLLALEAELAARKGKKADEEPLEEKGSTASLNRSPKVNWVEKAGQLPDYVREIASSIEKEGKHTLEEAIPIAIGRIKTWAHGGGGVTAETVAKAQKALAEWEALKAKSHLKYDSDLLDHLEFKTLAELAAVEAAWELLEQAGEVKAGARGSSTVVEEPVEEVKAEPVDDFADLIARGRELKAALGALGARS